MKKLLTLLILLVGGAFTTYAQHGYRGFADVSAGVLRNISDGKTGFNGTVSTTHGYQFNGHIFLGGGIELGYNTARPDLPEATVLPAMSDTYSFTKEPSNINLPVYLQFRYDKSLISSKSFYTACRVGYNVLSEGYIPYVAPEVGIQIRSSRTVSFNLGLRLSVSSASRYEVENTHTMTWTWPYIFSTTLTSYLQYDDVLASATITFGI